MIHSFQSCALLLFTSIVCISTAEEKETSASVPATGFDIAGAAARCVETQASTFQPSSQASAAIACTARGDTVVVWHSRRQEDNNYGIYAQRFAHGGERLGGEVRVNQYAPGPQTSPCVALDAAGGVWFAWESFGQDGDAGGIIARRFDLELATATAEVIVNDEHAGQQGDVSLACDAAGRALIAWTSPGEIPGQRVVRARRFLPDGVPAGPSFRVAGGPGSVLRNPCVTSDAQGRCVIAWAAADAAGQPSEIRARSYATNGQELGGECILSASTATSKSMPIEPVIALGERGELVAAWLSASGEDYVPTLRRFAWQVDENAWRGAEILLLATEAPGYGSALDLVLAPDGRAFVVGNRHVAREIDVCARVVERDGCVGEPRYLTCARAGDQAIQVGGGARRLALRADGGLALAWSGDAGQGDASAANLTLLLPAEAATESAGNPRRDATPRSEPLASQDPAAKIQRFADEAGAAPHDPPIEDPRGAIRREDFPATESLSLSGPDFGFLGIVQTNLTPPDPHIAVGPGHVVEVVNPVIAFFKKDGTFLSQQSMTGASGFWASVGAPANAFLFDPEVVFDVATGRFFAMANERSGGLSFLDLAVSDDADPTGTWFKYRFQTPVSLGDIDSPNFAVGAQEVYLSADFFNPTRYFVLVVEKAPLLTGGVPITANTTITGFQSHGLPMAYGPAATQYLIEALEAASNTSIRLHAIVNPLSAPSIQTFTLAVPAYQLPEDPPQMGTSSRPETFEARFWSCMYRNGSIWATHHTGSSRVLQRWYQIDMQGWPVSGNFPVLVQSGDVDPGPSVRTFFGSIFADAQDNVGMVFARSSPTEFISMSRTYRLAGDPAGATTPAVVMKASTAPDTTGRWGDYSAVVGDPSFNGVFWAGHEFRTSNWATWIGTFGPCVAPASYCTAKVTSQGLVPMIAASGQPSLGQNAFQLVMTNGIPNATVLYFYGAAPANVPWFNGTLCVQPPIVRGPPTSFDPSGAISSPFPIDIGLVGTERYFQYWFRDTPQLDGTGVGSSDGLHVTFCP